MKPEDVKFDVKKFQKLFDDEKLSEEAKLIKYGYISGWLQGVFANDRILKTFKNTKNFQEACEKVLGEDFKNFREQIKF